jgi:hypothetical protein
MTLLDPPFLGEDKQSGLPVLMIAMDLVGSSCVFLTVDMEGLLRVQYDKELRTDWRYDLKKREWYDKSSLGSEDE